jgi:hypothetical protein
MTIDEEKTAFNARAKASMLEYLKSRTWPEKIRSIERMNEAAKIARDAMKVARKRETAGPDGA